ncbi:MAG TPA: glycosyltransferase family 39 protein, partial [Kofleriaceae bacterium]|nr:glycosyltransferase family 39 protein [Kofleriaceae bacterium]
MLIPNDNCSRANRDVVLTRRLLAIAVVVQLVVFFAMPRDTPASDPLAYAENAYAIATNFDAYFTDPPNHPFAMRVGLTMPVAAMYRVFGAPSIITHLLSLLATLAILLVVYCAAPSARAKRFGIAFATCSSTLVLHGTILHVDLVCGAATAWMLFFLCRRDRSTWWTAAAVVMWFVAFLIKETAIWFAPAWIYVLVADVRGAGWRHGVRAYAAPLAVAAVLGTTYLAICAHVWGDPLARFTGTEALVGQHMWSAERFSTTQWLERLTWGPPWLFVTKFGAVFVVACLGARCVAPRERPWLVGTVGFLVIFWFGTTSSHAYEPLPLIPRMVLPAL